MVPSLHSEGIALEWHVLRSKQASTPSSRREGNHSRAMLGWQECRTYGNLGANAKAACQRAVGKSLCVGPTPSST